MENLYEDVVLLKEKNVYVTHNDKDAFKVLRGIVLVYIVPWKNEQVGRRAYVYKAIQGEVIPSFSHRDIEYNLWRFCLIAVDNAEVGIIKNGSTSILKKHFAEKINLESYDIEGFETSLTEKYKLNILAEDSLIHKTGQEQIETNENTFKIIYNVFNKKQKPVFERNRFNDQLYDTVNLICNRYDIPIATFEKIKETCGSDITVSNIARISHFSFREVVLDEDWYTSDSGPIICFTEDDKPIACIPKGTGRYMAHSIETGDNVLVNKKLAGKIKPRAFVIYRPFPTKQFSTKELIGFCFKCVNKVDITGIIVYTLLTTLIGMLLPILNQILFDDLIPLGDFSAIIQISFVIGAFMVGNVLFSIVKNIFTFRASTRMAYDVQMATYDRLFNLPENFFRKYESGDLAQRVTGIGEVVNLIATNIYTTFLSAVFSIVYLVMMFSYSSRLSWFALLMIFIYATAIGIISYKMINYQREIAGLEGKTNSILFQFLNGISKIRIAGVEDRTLYEYLKPFIEIRNTEKSKAFISNIQTAITAVISSVFTMVLYYLMIRSNIVISLGQFIAFVSAFSIFTASTLSLVSTFLEINILKPVYNRYKPIMGNAPEYDDTKDLPGDLSGEIEISNVTFSYSDDSTNVIDDITLNISNGEYVGVVGASGSGKSTLLKLLLGFEKPTNGRIYYDGKDIESIDKRELRKKFGVVLQDGKLIAGSIFENITIASPQKNTAKVKEVVKAVGLEKDIENMPMGLHTVLSEDCGTISGGQQQRILIARAIISDPKIIFFDEATSALDNLTQAKVCESLDKMDATRIVIAHRLSTIMNCERIIVMDNGKIAEEGTYDSLMKNKGLFFKLASRQLS